MNRLKEPLDQWKGQEAFSNWHMCKDLKDMLTMDNMKSPKLV